MKKKIIYVAIPQEPEEDIDTVALQELMREWYEDYLAEQQQLQGPVDELPDYPFN